jgi:hypothetical protein
MADTAATETTSTGTGEETRASTEIALHVIAFHHHLAEAAMPTETETTKITALRATIAEAEVAAVALAMTEIRAWGHRRARRSLWKALRRI